MRDAAAGRVAPDEYVEFLQMGDLVKGEFHCSDCGYGVIVSRQLPQCPMCGCETWEESTWSPFRRANLVA